jgi:hypothetical protein
LARKTYYGAFAVIAIVSFIIVDTAARDRSGNLKLSRKSWKPDTTITGQTKIDTTGKKDTLKYPLKDRRGPNITDPSRGGY